MEISISFQTAFIAIFQIFLMGSVGFCASRFRLWDESVLKSLSWVMINIVFPIYIFYQILTHFNPQTQSNWWSYPLINIGVCLLGLFLAWMLSNVFKIKDKYEFLASSSLHNAGYIPLLLITVLPLSQQVEELNALVILTIIGFDLCLWTIGARLIGHHHNVRINLKSFLNPPLISMFLGFLCVLLGIKEYIPSQVLKPINIMGQGALGLAMLVIGGNLGFTVYKRIAWKRISGVVLIKLLILPGVVLLFLKALHISSLWGFVLMIQACMPSSITLSVLGRYYDNSRLDFINQVIFVTHLLCGLTIPLFLGIYGSAG